MRPEICGVAAAVNAQSAFLKDGRNISLFFPFFASHAIAVRSTGEKIDHLNNIHCFFVLLRGIGEWSLIN